MSEIKSLLIIAVVACIFIVSTSLYIGSVYQGYENIDDITYLDKSTDITSQVESMQDRIQPSGNQMTDALSFMLLSSYNDVMMVFEIIPIFNSLGTSIGDIFGIPATIINLIMLIISIILIIEIIYILTGRSGS